MLDWDEYTDHKGSIDVMQAYKDIAGVRPGFTSPAEQAALLFLLNFETFGGGTGSAQIASLALAQARALEAMYERTL